MLPRNLVLMKTTIYTSHFTEICWKFFLLSPWLKKKSLQIFSLMLFFTFVIVMWMVIFPFGWKIEIFSFSSPFSFPFYMGGISTVWCWPCQRCPIFWRYLSPQCLNDSTEVGDGLYLKQLFKGRLKLADRAWPQNCFCDLLLRYFWR